MKLNEWKDKNGNQSNLPKSPVASKPVSKTSTSTGFKKRFNKLIHYYGQHLPNEIDHISVTLLTNDSLAFVEYYSDNTKVGFDIYIGPQTEAWRLKVSVDGNLNDDLAGQGWPELLKTLRHFISVPVVSTPEYKDILTEWVDKDGNKSNLPKSSSTTSATQTSTKNYPDQTDRYKKLLAQIDSDGISEYSLNSLTDRVLDITVNTVWKKGIQIQIVYKPYVPNYTFIVNKNNQLSFDTYEELLEFLITSGVIADTDLCESATSVAEDFLLYENLWD